MQKSSMMAFILVAAGSCAAMGAWAQERLPAGKQAGEVHYSCGGIGLDESSAMRAAMKDYPLALLFAAANGEYLADLQVELQSAQGSEKFTAGGPICLLRLPAGHYTVKSTTKDGRSQSQKVQVGAGSKTLDFRF